MNGAKRWKRERDGKGEESASVRRNGAVGDTDEGKQGPRKESVSAGENCGDTTKEAAERAPSRGRNDEADGEKRSAGAAKASAASEMRKTDGGEGRTEGLGPIFQREAYADYVKKHARPSPLLRDMVRAFFVGGGLCAAGEGLFWLFRSLGIGEERGRLFVTLFFILLAGVLTAVGLFDRIARFGGAGTLVPVTGFSNSVVAAAVDSRAEGLVTGVGAKMFTVAGPVIVYGTAAGAAFGVALWLLGWIGDKM